MTGRKVAFNATRNMSSEAPVVRASVTYMGPALTVGSGLRTKSRSETSIISATMATTQTRRRRLKVRTDLPLVADDVRPPLLTPCGALLDLALVIVSPL